MKGKVLYHNCVKLKLDHLPYLSFAIWVVALMGFCLVVDASKVWGKDWLVYDGMLAPPVVTDSVNSSGLTALINDPYLVLLAGEISPV